MNRTSLYLLALGMLGALARAEENPGPVVELPKFVVTDTRALPPPESWRYATIPGFEILSNSSDRTTQRLINDFELFRTALNVVWPQSGRIEAPTMLILSGRGAKFDAFVPDGETSVDTARASIFLRRGEQTAIVIDMQSAVVNVQATEADDPASGTDSSQISVDHNKQLYREYVHYLLSRAEPRLPAWFEEGMAQLVMGIKFYPTWIEFGKLEDPNTVSAQAGMTAQMNAAMASDDPDGATLPGAPAEDLDFNAALNHKALVPMDQFFALPHDAPAAVNILGNNRWAKQAYAFVHMCLYGENKKFQKPFSQFLLRIMKGETVTEPMFKECFKMSYKDMLLTLRGYIEFTNYESKEYRAKKGEKLPVPPPLVLRDATQSEVGRIKGETFLLAGHQDRARTELIAPYIRGERDPQLLASLGLYEHSDGKDDRARIFLAAAVAGKAVRPEAYLQLARFRFDDAMAKPAAPGGKFSDAQVAGIVDPLLASRRQPPAMSATYDLLADTWLRRASTTTKDDVAVMVDGVRMFPGHMRLAYATAMLAADAGMNEAAHSLADHGIRYAPDAASKAKFVELKAKLPPEVPAAEAAPAGAPGKMPPATSK